MIQFEVSVPEFNAQKFSDDYSQFIDWVDETPFGDAWFALTAPVEVYEEICGLEEEMISVEYVNA